MADSAMADAAIADAAETSPTVGAAHAVKDKPWVMRTYAGHSSPRKSNALYLRNLDKGQTGLSIAFDLPTQTGYDPDDPIARGEVGKVGVPIAHRGDMARLLDKPVVAEFVETASVAQLLRELGVQWGQGYYFHQPEPLTFDALQQQARLAQQATTAALH